MAEKSRHYKTELKRDDYRSSHRDRHRSRSKSRPRTDRDRRVHHRSRSRSRSPKRSYKRRTSYSRSRSRSVSRSKDHSRRRRRHSRNQSRSHSRSRSYRRRHNRSRSRSPSKDRKKSSYKSKSKSRSKSRQRDVSSSRSASESKSRDHHTSSTRHKTHDDTEINTELDIDMPDDIKTEPKPAYNIYMPKRNVQADGAYCNLDVDAPIDKEKIHKDIEEKLRLALAREGKVYPPPKQEASHPVFANDGSFLEIFKKMQEQGTSSHQKSQDEDVKPYAMQMMHSSQTAPSTSTSASTSKVPAPQLPVFGRRRGGKILKTGLVAKPKILNESDGTDPKDFWAIYLREVNKYKNAACESDGQTRPLVK